MDIVDFTLKDYKLYSPSTGELLYDAGKKLINTNAKSLAGYWEYDSDDYHDYYECWYDSNSDEFYHIFHIITINNAQLCRAWDKYLIDFSWRVQDMEEKVKFNLEDFIINYDRDPSLICFRIQNPEKPADRVYYVIEMNGNPKSLE